MVGRERRGEKYFVHQIKSRIGPSLGLRKRKGPEAAANSSRLWPRPSEGAGRSANRRALLLEKEGRTCRRLPEDGRRKPPIRAASELALVPPPPTEDQGEPNSRARRGSGEARVWSSLLAATWQSKGPLRCASKLERRTPSGEGTSSVGPLVLTTGAASPPPRRTSEGRSRASWDGQVGSDDKGRRRALAMPLPEAQDELADERGSRPAAEREHAPYVVVVGGLALLGWCAAAKDQ